MSQASIEDASTTTADRSRPLSSSGLPQIDLRQDFLPQKVLNLFPFKGKGSVAMQLFAVRNRREKLRFVADQVVALVRGVPSKSVSLVYGARGSGWELVWRGVSRNAPRCAWTDQRIQSLLVDVQMEWMVWYVEIARTVMVLNCEEAILTREQNELEALLVELELTERMVAERGLST